MQLEFIMMIDLLVMLLVCYNFLQISILRKKIEELKDQKEKKQLLKG